MESALPDHKRAQASRAIPDAIHTREHSGSRPHERRPPPEAMAASTSAATILLPALSSLRGGGGGGGNRGVVCLGGRGHVRAPAVGRRQSLLLLSVSAPLALGLAPARAEDIGLFGLRKKLRTIEEEAEEVVREGERAVEKGIEAAEKEIQVAEKEIGAAAAGAATGLELGLGGDLAQAGAVAAAEVVGVLAAVSVVNGILGPEGRSS
ncbi:hypothetical protein Taro_013787 [Colocasia esculenta]|uniref:Uncharacterized protein n=1 Tax=Colocasia esculenta TaxID=4460 RepID=A0A843UJT7_COLES|nr:hypothetical protein [Colocasia esculenta]